MRRSLFLATSLSATLAFSLTLSGGQTPCQDCQPQRGPWGDGYGTGSVSICFQDPADSSVVTDRKADLKVGFDYWKNVADAAGQVLTFTYSDGKEPNNLCSADVVVRKGSISSWGLASPQHGIELDSSFFANATAGQAQWVGAHEYGHVAGWANVDTGGCTNATVMFNGVRSSLQSVTCADEAVARAWFGGGPCDIDPDGQECCQTTPGGYWNGNQCIPFTPLIVAFGGESSLSTVDGGVMFALVPSGPKVQISWTRPGSDAAWVVLDRNRNGRIDDATELFSSTAEQPPSDSPNGFQALRMFDSTGDEWIDSQDAVYPSLLLWTDRNHDGISQGDELKSLGESGIDRLSLHYRSTRRVDRAGNQWRYRARIVGDGAPSLWDVILQMRQSPISQKEIAACVRPAPAGFFGFLRPGA